MNIAANFFPQPIPEIQDEVTTLLSYSDQSIDNNEFIDDSQLGSNNEYSFASLIDGDNKNDASNEEGNAVYLLPCVSNYTKQVINSIDELSKSITVAGIVDDAQKLSLECKLERNLQEVQQEVESTLIIEDNTDFELNTETNEIFSDTLNYSNTSSNTTNNYTANKIDGKATYNMPTNDDLVTKQINDQLVTNISKGTDSFSFALMPKELGEVKVAMNFSDKTIAINVNSAEVQNILEKNLHILENNLNNAGFAGMDFSFEHNNKQQKYHEKEMQIMAKEILNSHQGNRLLDMLV